MSSRLRLEPYVAQAARWPRAGKHVMAQFDADSVVVYQAYRPAIGRFAATHGWFGGDFSLARMSWIKPNFLWMMYRSGWGQQANQEVVLAVWLRRDAFDEILAQAVASSFGASGLVDRAACPGLRDDYLARYGDAEIAAARGQPATVAPRRLPVARWVATIGDTSSRWTIHARA